MRYLVTGHTGFKGAWLALMLTERGHEVSGLALDPLPGALFELAAIGERLRDDLRLDIRDEKGALDAITSVSPDVVVHLAAQPLVRASYEQPRWTMETNVMGTLSVLEAVRAAPSVKAAVMVTTDKVYRNVGQSHGYVESDALGGHDPYSASKAMADILVASWVDSFPGCPTAVARAGNVIGGGDVSRDRLFPDLIRGFRLGGSVPIRNPRAVRPWQHVLDCLNGYLLLVEALLGGQGSGAWNFGPDARSFRTVGEAADCAAGCWGPSARWTTDEGDHPHEAELLTLDAGRARRELGWTDRLGFEESVSWTIDWAKQVATGGDALAVSLAQVRAFDAMATIGARP